MALPKGYEKISLKDYRSQPETERRELIKGVAWSISPAPTLVQPDLRVCCNDSIVTE